MATYKGILCPNHAEPLEDVPTPLPEKGTGTCPVSGCEFEFEADPATAKVKLNTKGEYETTYQYKVRGAEILDD